MLEKQAHFKSEIANELDSILDFWVTHAVDITLGGFVGRIDSQGIVHHEAEKGCVLNARILWTFAAAFNKFKNPVHYLLAERAYNYIQTHFHDLKNGGVYWSVDAAGKPLNTRKQIYGLAFTIYGLSEFYQNNQKQEVLDFAISLFELIEKYSYDREDGGYWEAFGENWQPMADLRLSEKDRNDPKIMNTHLHIIEAYVNLYRIWPEQRVASKIRHLLEVFEKHIIDPETFHMKLFFNGKWESQSKAISYGHDIEATWLLHEAAEVLHDRDLIKKWEDIALRMADAAARGFMPDGSLIHEYNPETHHADTHREWWVSAEGMVGYLNAYQISNDNRYLEKVTGLWIFVQQHLLDKGKGEWFWGVYEDYSKMQEDKIGFWKCPYHNARACLEILKRI
ncbi:AGE family epimerase/isomerase [Dyadobacter diqingensis]|uniref:AGE family epimerase/isomerase n=1 Tax=Dyadobacter diqingensis TaxID=2938121 RepID=UPI0020C1B61C|nr:AGE family epimerase/isomerase [Dyadobacter diqingensis]